MEGVNPVWTVVAANHHHRAFQPVRRDDDGDRDHADHRGKSSATRRPPEVATLTARS